MFDAAPTGSTTPPPAPSIEALLEKEVAVAYQRPDRRVAPERDLALRFGLTRAAVRRLLEQLEQEGRVIRQVGRGTFVLPVGTTRDGVGADGLHTSPAEIMQVRLLVEPQILKLTVANASVADLTEMRRCLAKSESAAGYQDFERWDTRLHTLMVESSRNRLLNDLYTVVNKAREDPVWGSAKSRSFTPQRRAAYEQDHRELVAAVEDRDSATAASVMRRHLLHIQSALIGLDTGGQQPEEGEAL